MTQAKDAFTTVAPLRVRVSAAAPASRDIPEETAVALVHDGATFAVMLATPADIEDFAVGLSLSEGVIENAGQVRDIDVVVTEHGIEARLWLERPVGVALSERRRALAGPTGCGLCGIESLQALSAAPQPEVPAGGATATVADVAAMLNALQTEQALGAATRAVHAAGFWTPNEGLVVVREDVGRHNALDKVAGALARQGRDGRGGVIVLTSRVSIDMVQKTLRLGAAMIVAVSAPTSMAVRAADAAGLTLIAVARDDGFEVFTHPTRVKLE